LLSNSNGWFIFYCIHFEIFLLFLIHPSSYNMLQTTQKTTTKNLSHQNEFHVFTQNIRRVRIFSECFVQLNYNILFSFTLWTYLVKHKINPNHLQFRDLFFTFYHYLEIAFFPEGIAIILNVILLCPEATVSPENTALI